MKCPHLSKKSNTCLKMLEMGLDGEVSNFDLKHFCNSNPTYCYYFRLRTQQEGIDERKETEGIELKNNITQTTTKDNMETKNAHTQNVESLKFMDALREMLRAFNNS